MYVTWRIDRTPSVSNAWSSANTETITTYNDPILTTESGEGRDSFSLKLTNFNDNWSNYFKIQDKIEIYRVTNSDTTTSANLLMTGVVSNVPETESSADKTIRVEGYNYSESVMSAIVFHDSSGQTIPAALEGAINSVKFFNSGKAVTWNTNNPTLKKDNVTAFPTVGQRFFYKPLRDLIETYSVNTKTEDGTYFWYVDKDNTLVWRPATTTVSVDGDGDPYSFNSSTDTYRTLKIGKDLKDIKNYIIVKAGMDPENNAIQLTVPSYSSITKNGFKFYIDTSIVKESGDIHTADCNKAGVNHMRDASYPFQTTFWKSEVTHVYESFDSYDAYLVKFRLHMRERCAQVGAAIIEVNALGRLEITVDFPPGYKQWGLGDLVTVIIASLGSSKAMRVTGIQYTTTGDSFTLKEDIGKGSIGK
jgi:hypothetical protein